MTTRNAFDTFGVGWFMGGLHFQIEHHLWPTIPRHNLYKVQPVVEALCRKHRIPYRVATMWEGTLDVLQHLKEIANALEDFPAM